MTAIDPGTPAGRPSQAGDEPGRASSGRVHEDNDRRGPMGGSVMRDGVWRREFDGETGDPGVVVGFVG